MDIFDPFSPTTGDGTATGTRETSTSSTNFSSRSTCTSSAHRDLLDIFGGGDFGCPSSVLESPSLENAVGEDTSSPGPERNLIFNLTDDTYEIFDESIATDNTSRKRRTFTDENQDSANAGQIFYTDLDDDQLDPDSSKVSCNNYPVVDLTEAFNDGVLLQMNNTTESSWDTKKPCNAENSHISRAASCKRHLTADGQRVQMVDLETREAGDTLTKLMTECLDTTDIHPVSIANLGYVEEEFSSDSLEAATEDCNPSQGLLNIFKQTNSKLDIETEDTQISHKTKRTENIVEELTRCESVEAAAESHDSSDGILNISPLCCTPDLLSSQLEYCTMNLDMSKQKALLCRKSAIAQRRRPSRRSLQQKSTSPDRLFIDSTDCNRPATSVSGSGNEQSVSPKMVHSNKKIPTTLLGMEGPVEKEFLSVRPGITKAVMTSTTTVPADDCARPSAKTNSPTSWTPSSFTNSAPRTVQSKSSSSVVAEPSIASIKAETAPAGGRRTSKADENSVSRDHAISAANTADRLLEANTGPSFVGSAAATVPTDLTLQYNGDRSNAVHIPTPNILQRLKPWGNSIYRVTRTSQENRVFTVDSRLSNAVSSETVISIHERLISTETASDLKNSFTDGVRVNPRSGLVGSWSSMCSSRQVGKADSASCVEECEGGSKRASIQGSAYNPMAFRPRCSSAATSIHTSLTPFSASRSQWLRPSSQTSAHGDDPRLHFSAPSWKAFPYKRSAWPFKTKSNVVDVSDCGVFWSPACLRKPLHDTDDAGIISERRAKRHVVVDVTGKRCEQVGSSQPDWRQTALEKTSRMAHTLQARTDHQDAGRLKEDREPVAPWLAEPQNRMKPGQLINRAVESCTNGLTSGTAQQTIVTGTSGVSHNFCSWTNCRHCGKTSHKTPAAAVKSEGTTVRRGPDTSPDGKNPMQVYETPRWKVELAEKKKRRKAEEGKTMEPPSTGHQLPSSGHQSQQTPSSGHQSQQTPSSGHQSPSSGHQLPSSGHQSPSSGHQSLSSRYKSPSSGHQSPSSRYKSPSSGHQSPSSRYKSPSSGHQSPSSGHQSPSSRYKSPSSGHQSPSSRYKSPSSGHQSPSSGHQSPSSRYKSPSSGHQSPSSGHQLPSSGHQSPSSGHQSPSSRYKSPSSGHQSPSSGHQLPSSGHQTPSSDDQCRNTDRGESPGQARNTSNSSFANGTMVIRTPVWIEQLVERRKKAQASEAKEEQQPKGGSGIDSRSNVPDWVRQAEERRARLISEHHEPGSGNDGDDDGDDGGCGGTNHSGLIVKTMSAN